MEGRLILSEAEWELVLELIRSELSTLPTEIRHTRTATMREELRRRQATLQALLDRLRTPAAAG